MKENAKVRAVTNSLRGKKGADDIQPTSQGVVSVEPVGCELTAEERGFFDGLPLWFLTHTCYPMCCSKPGDKWEVDGSAFSDFLPPSRHGVPGGSIIIERAGGFSKTRGSQYALLRCPCGNAAGGRDRPQPDPIGSASAPRGVLKYDVTKGRDGIRRSLTAKSAHRVKPPAIIYCSKRDSRHNLKSE